MLWIQSHAEIGQHPKAWALASALKVPITTTIGILHLLWHFTLKFSWRSGDLSRFTPAIIAQAVCWDGDSVVLIKALQETGWLDDLVVHNWLKYAGKIVTGRLYNEKRRSYAVKRRKTPLNAVKFCKTPSILEQSRVEQSRVEEEKRTTLSPEGDVTKLLDPSKSPTPENLVALWNSRAHQNLPKVAMLTAKRVTHIKARLVEHPEKKFWEELVERVNASPLLRGENGNGWKCSFDWILNVNNMAKILEGNYDAVKRNN